MIAQTQEKAFALGILQNKTTHILGGGDSFPIRQDINKIHRIYRWALQEEITTIMPPEHRIKYCMRRTIFKSGEVKLMYSPSVSRAHYKNLMTCSNIWVCPVCNSKIMTRRAVELKERLEQNNYYLYMVTFTIQHKKTDSLKHLLKDLSGAISYFRTYKKYWDTFKNLFSIVGTITGLEVRYSVNTGWHPHKHVLYVSENNNNDVKEIKKWVEYRYCLYLHDRGYTTNDITVNVIKMTSSDYIAKWGLENELTGGMLKKSSVSLSPFMLVPAGYISQFLEYSEAMRGQRSLVYSRDLKGILDSGITDKELNEYENEDSYKLLDLYPEVWKLIINKKLRGQLLEIASSGDINLVLQFLGQNSVHWQELD